MPFRLHAEYGLGGYLRGFFFCQLATPGNALSGRGSFATVVILQVAGRELAFFLPVMPALGTYLLAEVAVHEQRIAVITPRTTQIDLADTRGSGDAAVVEHIAVGLVLGRGGCGDVGVGLAEDVAMLEPRDGGTEDEVGGSLNVTVLEVKAGASHTGIDSVLIAQEAAVDKREAVALSMQGNGLPQSGGVVLNGDVLNGDILPLNLNRLSAESSHLIDVGMIVVGDDGLVTVLAADLDIGEPLGNDELLLIGAPLDKDDFMVLHEGAADFQRLVDGAELSCAVASHKDGVRVVEVLRSCAAK